MRTQFRFALLVEQDDLESTIKRRSATRAEGNRNQPRPTRFPTVKRLGCVSNLIPRHSLGAGRSGECHKKKVCHEGRPSFYGTLQIDLLRKHSEAESGIAARGFLSNILLTPYNPQHKPRNPTAGISWFYFWNLSFET